MTRVRYASSSHTAVNIMDEWSVDYKTSTRCTVLIFRSGAFGILKFKQTDDRRWWVGVPTLKSLGKTSVGCPLTTNNLELSFFRLLSRSSRASSKNLCAHTEQRNAN